MHGYSQWSSPSYLGAPEAPRGPVFREPPAWAAPSLPPAYGGCRCPCHSTPGVVHVVACCHPRSSPAWGDDMGAAAISRAAMYQLAKAYAGSRLASPEQAEDAATMASVPTTTATAYLKAGYWMAVAARIAGSRLLAASAQIAITKGNSLLMVTVGAYEQVTTAVASILTDAATTVRGYGVASVAARLDALAASASTIKAQEQRAKQTVTPFDDIAVARDKYGKYIAGGVAVVAGIGLLALLRSATAPRKSTA